VLTREKSELTIREWGVLKKLSTPSKIQDYLNSLAFNHEKNGETNMSVREVLKSKRAHCFEGALLAAAGLAIQGHKPLVLDLKARDPDFDHVVALFQQDGYWGAISKTNHAVLRYREPVYKTVRELAMSYFNEYFLPTGEKTLRSFSKPFNLNKYTPDWLVSEDNLEYIAHDLDWSPHVAIVPKGLRLRLADPIERKAGEISGTI
jgi:hypothetical protein